MKFKALRTKREPKEFVHIDTIATTMILYTGDLPKPQPLTATLEGMKEYYKNDIPLPDQLTLDDLELVEFEMYEADTIGADIRNKLSPCKTLVSLLEEYFSVNVVHASEERSKLVEFIKNEMARTKINIKYIANLL
jgi:hypothetical protein